MLVIFEDFSSEEAKEAMRAFIDDEKLYFVGYDFYVEDFDRTRTGGGIEFRLIRVKGES